MDLHASLYHQEYCQYQKYLLALSLPVPRCAVDDTELHSDSNISKEVRVNIALRGRFLRNIQ